MSKTVTVVLDAFNEKEIVIRDQHQQVTVVRRRGDFLEAEIWAPLAFDAEIQGGPSQTIQEGDYDDWVVASSLEMAQPLL